ncbi:MAG: hypothetical protein OEY38_15535 [Gammaproteobacteria bacterium]|nr:hypothetical protein [Gammaproteobacteria bacterium]
MKNSINQYLFVLIILLVLPINSFAKTLQVKIGSHNIDVLIPPGFANPCEESRDIQKLFLVSTPATHRLLACFIEQNEFKLFPEVDPNANNPYVQIQSQ